MNVQSEQQRSSDLITAWKYGQEQTVLIRGGVEDTKLEAKDTKKSQAKAKDSASENRPSRGQGPRLPAQVFSKIKKVFKIIFRAISKKGLQKFFFRRSTKFEQFKK